MIIFFSPINFLTILSCFIHFFFLVEPQLF